MTCYVAPCPLSCSGTPPSCLVDPLQTVGVVTLKHVYEIARAKMPEFPKRFTLATVCRTVIAQCRSMGVAVVADEEAAVARYPQCKG